MKNIVLPIRKTMLFAMTVIVAASFVLSALPVTTASATPANDKSTNPNDWNVKTRATRWAYLTGLYNCLDDSKYLGNRFHEVDDKKIGRGDWWAAPPGPGDRFNEPAGYIGISTKKNGNGKSDCNNVVKGTMKAYSLSGTELFCKLGGKRKDGTSCVGSRTSPGFKWPSKHARLNVSSWWGTKNLPKSAGDSAYYLLNLAAFTDSKGCNASTKGATGNGDDGYAISTVDDKGHLTKTKYVGQKHGHKINVYTSYPGINNQYRSCKTIASDLGKQAGAFAKWVRGHLESAGDNTKGKDGEGSSDPSCSIDGIGWIICPVFFFMGDLNEQASKAVERILIVEPTVLTSTTTKDAWESFRNIANVLFVIAFLIIIYSQMTGFGVSNYGLKRLLPKIIIAAILVNVSFYICQAAADISNILGSSLSDFFRNIPVHVKERSGPSGWDGLIGSILKLGVGVSLIAAIVLAPVVLIAFGLILLILVARKALIIILIIISPLAFVAYLLPNTEQWAKKWWKMFSTLLLLFPIIAIVFGVSSFASKILMGVAGDGDSDDTLLLAIVALSITAIPLLAIPSLLKGALSSAGSIGQKISGFQDSANKRAGTRLKSRGERYGNRIRAANINRARKINNADGGRFGEAGSKRRRATAFFAGAGATRAVDSEEKDKYAKIGAEAAQRNYVADRASDDDAYAKKIAGGSELAGLAQSYAVQAQEEEFNKDVKASQVLLRNKAKKMTPDDYSASLSDTINDDTKAVHERVAAISEYGSVAGDDKVGDLVDQMATLGAGVDPKDGKARDDVVKLQRALKSSFSERMPVNVGARDKAMMESGGFVADEATRMTKTVDGGKISSSHIGRMKFEEMKSWNKKMTENPDMLRDGNVSPEKIQAMHESIIAAEKDPRINVNFGDREKTQLTAMKSVLEKQWSSAQSAKDQQDSAASTYGPNI